MYDYLDNLREKPEHHRKYFAMGVSGCFTAIIFLIWVFVKFGGAATVVAENVPDREVQAVSPFDGIGNGIANAWSSVSGQFGKAKDEVKTIELQSKYEDMRDNALNN